MEAVTGSVLLMLFLIILAIVWILLPFAVFGTKPKLDELKAELRNTNAQLAKIAELLQHSNRIGSPTAAPPESSGHAAVP